MSVLRGLHRASGDWSPEGEVRVWTAVELEGRLTTEEEDDSTGELLAACLDAIEGWTPSAACRADRVDEAHAVSCPACAVRALKGWMEEEDGSAERGWGSEAEPLVHALHARVTERLEAVPRRRLRVLAGLALAALLLLVPLIGRPPDDPGRRGSPGVAVGELVLTPADGVVVERVPGREDGLTLPPGPVLLRWRGVPEGRAAVAFRNADGSLEPARALAPDEVLRLVPEGDDRGLVFLTGPADPVVALDALGRGEGPREGWTVEEVRWAAP